MLKSKPNYRKEKGMQGKKTSSVSAIVGLITLMGVAFTVLMVNDFLDQKNIQRTEKLMTFQRTTSVPYEIKQVGKSPNFVLRFPHLAKGEFYFYGCTDESVWLSSKARRYLRDNNGYAKKFLQTRDLRPAPFHEAAMDVSILRKVIPYPPCSNLYYHEPEKDDWIVIETSNLFPEILYVNHEDVFPAKIWKIASNGNMANGNSR